MRIVSRSPGLVSTSSGPAAGYAPSHIGQRLLHCSHSSSRSVTTDNRHCFHPRKENRSHDSPAAFVSSSPRIVHHFSQYIPPFYQYEVSRSRPQEVGSESQGPSFDVDATSPLDIQESYPAAFPVVHTCFHQFAPGIRPPGSIESDSVGVLGK